MATANVSVLKTGTGFTVDVTACNLLADLTVKDFQVFHGGTLFCDATSPSGCPAYAKTTQTTLTYSGAALASNTTVQVRRKTPSVQVQPVNRFERITSGLWNTEHDRHIRWREEADLNGVGPGSSITLATPLDTAYGVSWDGNIVNPPTMNAVYDALQLFAPLASPTLTGTPSAPTAADGTSTTQLATTAFAATRVANALSGSPALGGNPTATTQSLANDTTRLATTAFVQDSFRPAFLAMIPSDQLNQNGAVVVNYTTEIFDTDACYDTTNKLFTAPSAGYYMFGAGFAYRSTVSVAGRLEAYIQTRNSGGTMLQELLLFYDDFSSNIIRSNSSSVIVSLTTGDTVRVIASDAAGAYDLDILFPRAVFWGFKLGI